MCFMHKNWNEQYNAHRKRKDRARKDEDKEEVLKGQYHVLAMDVQSVKVAPQIVASALYYKTKLCCHNFTNANDWKDRQATCYWYDETNADG